MAKEQLVVGHAHSYPIGKQDPMREIPQPPPGWEPKTFTEAECRERERNAFVAGATSHDDNGLRLITVEAEAEARRRYGGEVTKAKRWNVVAKADRGYLSIHPEGEVVLFGDYKAAIELKDAAQAKIDALTRLVAQSSTQYRELVKERDAADSTTRTGAKPRSSPGTGGRSRSGRSRSRFPEGHSK